MKILNKYPQAIKLAIPFAIIAVNTQTLYAADGVALTDEGLELTVTANRRPLSNDAVLASTSIITREQIESSNAQSVTDVLRLQNGIDVSSNGGEGSTTGIFLRGASNSQTLVLIDGVRVASASTGGLNFGGLSLDQIERIEIVRGPRAAIYGSDAVGGVIQIFTRKKSGTYVDFQLGKYGTSGVSLGTAKNSEKTNFALNVSTKNATGFSATNEQSSFFNEDADGYNKKSINGSLSHQITDDIKVGLNISHSESKADYDQGVSDLVVQTASTYLESKINDNWKQKISLNNTRNDLVSDSGGFAYIFNTKHREVNWQNDITLSDNTDFIFGASYRKTKGDTAAFKGNITNKAVYGNLLKRKGKVRYDAALRYDKHSQAGSDVNGQISVGYKLNPLTTAYASYGTAFRAPTINDLYHPGFNGTFGGNENLLPEQSKSFEVGLKTNIGTYNKLEFNIFRTEVEDAIAYGGSTSSRINIDESLMKGVELSLLGNTDRFDWKLGTTIQRAVNSITGDRLIRRPNNKFSLDLGTNITPKTRLGMDALLVSSRTDRGSNLSSYSLLNLSANHKVSNNVSVGIRLENAFDEKYQLAYGYNTPRRGVFFTFSYRE